MHSRELSAAHRAKLFSALLQLDQQQGGWDKVFQLLNEGQRAARQAQIPALVEQLEQGQTVVLEGLKKTGQFLSWELNLLEMGLATGNIRESYQRLRDHYLLQQKMAEEVAKNIKFPMLVVFVGITGLLWWQLPLSIDLLVLRLALTALFLYGIVFLGRRLVYRYRQDSSAFNSIKHFPGLKEVLELGQTYHYLKNLNQSIDSGLSLKRSLKLAAQKIPDAI